MFGRGSLLTIRESTSEVLDSGFKNRTRIEIRFDGVIDGQDSRKRIIAFLNQHVGSPIRFRLALRLQYPVSKCVLMVEKTLDFCQFRGSR